MINLQRESVLFKASPDVMRLMSKIPVVFVLLPATTLVAPAQKTKPKKQTAKRFGHSVRIHLDYLETELAVKKQPND